MINKAVQVFVSKKFVINIFYTGFLQSQVMIKYKLLISDAKPLQLVTIWSFQTLWRETGNIKGTAVNLKSLTSNRIENSFE